MVLAAFDRLGNYYEGGAGGSWRGNGWHGRIGRGQVQRRCTAETAVAHAKNPTSHPRQTTNPGGKTLGGLASCA
jgi:hypothetical protein